MKRWWVSFAAHEDLLSQFCYNGPWWVAGYSDDKVNVCMAVCADTEHEAQSVVRRSFDRTPEHMQWRFIEERPADWAPYTSRFTKAEWMVWPLSPQLALELRK